MKYLESEKEKAESQKNLFDMTRERDQLQSEVHQLRNENEDKKEKIQELKDRIDELKQKGVQEFKAKINDAMFNYNLLAQENKDLEKNRSQLLSLEVGILCSLMNSVEGTNSLEKFSRRLERKIQLLRKGK